MVNEKHFGFGTQAVHAGRRPDPMTGSRAVPIYQTTAYIFEDTAHAANLFALQRFGNVYSRIMNPTVAVFEERIAALENGIGAVATASGQAAQHIALFSLMGAGDEFIASTTLYGGTVNQFDVTFRKVGINPVFVNIGNHENIRRAITPRTKCIFAETLGNPKIDVPDIEAVSAIAHENGISLVVDNTFASPYCCRPIDWGADIVLHSATKFICGHGTTMGGVIIDAGRFPWNNGKFPGMTEPSKGYHNLRFFEYFGDLGWLLKVRGEMLRDYGPCQSPFNAFLLLQGLETLHVRMERHVSNARHVAEYLKNHEAVTWVNYPGFPDSPYYDLCKKYFPVGPGAIFTFDIKSGREARKKLIENVQLFSHLANVGDCKSLIIHPATTTHQQLTDEELAACGIGPDMIRLSIGIEDIDDILWDLGQALEKSQQASPITEAPAMTVADQFEPSGHSLLSKAFGAVPKIGQRQMAVGDRTQLGGTAYDRLRILTTCRTIAMVGLSANPYHPSDFAAIYLAANGYKIIPVNPSQAGKTILGERVYSRIDEIDHQVDIVDVFRPSAEVPDIARQAVKIKAKVLWLQLGIISEDGGKVARDGGLEVVMDRCCKIEHARFFGGLRTIGLNTGVITSRLALKIPA
jgi:O-acetylhomoserine (thiol)-lyase